MKLQGTPATHSLTGRELRALRRLQREQEPKSPFVLVSERGSVLNPWLSGFHPHMLRHACGYNLANDGVDTRTIKRT